MLTMIGRATCWDARGSDWVTVEGHLPRMSGGGGYSVRGGPMFNGGYVYDASLEDAPSARQLFSRTSMGGIFLVDFPSEFPWDYSQNLRDFGPGFGPGFVWQARAASEVESGQAHRYLHIRVPGINRCFMSAIPSYWILWVDLSVAPGFQGNESNVAYRWGRSPNGVFWFAVGRDGQAPAARKVPGFGR